MQAPYAAAHSPSTQLPLPQTFPHSPQLPGSWSSAAQQPGIGPPDGSSAIVCMKLAPHPQPQQPQFVGAVRSNATVFVSKPGAEIVAS
jgi:hypothetical protein